jgi:DNA-binding response OmpR family regulator
MRTLVVDDCRDGADSLALLLGRYGHTVKVAYDGATALQVAASFAPEAVILDVAMPGMNGFDTARGLRGIVAAEHPVLIAVSGFSRDTDRARAHEAGFDHYFVKPMEVECLLQVLGTPAPR